METLRAWLKTSAGVSTGQADRQNREAGRVQELESEVRALRKQLGEEVINVLKKPRSSGTPFYGYTSEKLLDHCCFRHSFLCAIPSYYR